MSGKLDVAGYDGDIYEGVPCINALPYHLHGGLDSGTRVSGRCWGVGGIRLLLTCIALFSLGYSYRPALHLYLARRLAEFHV
jgi:hypothetical protein